MPARCYDAKKPSFYLDTSTLCDVVRAMSLTDGNKEYLPLAGWIDRVSREANLCLSVFHLADLSGWENQPAAEAVVSWIDLLETVWLEGPQAIQQAETRWWVRSAVGLATPPLEPFAGSMLAAMEDLDVADASSFIGRDDLALRFLQSFRLREGDRQRRAMLQWAGIFHKDREWAEQSGWSEERKLSRLDAHRHRDLRERAREAEHELRVELDLEFLAASSNRSVGDDLLRVVSQYQTSMPAWRVAHAFVEHFAAKASERIPGSRKWLTQGSSFVDYVHAVGGGAYCDVFTCDAEVYDAVAPVRTRLGRRRTLSVKRSGSANSFVAELRSTWP